MIFNEEIDFSIKNPYGNTYLNNSASYFSEDNWDFLNKIYNKEIPMFSSAYSILANTLENFYKGVYFELKKIHPEIKRLSENELFSHKSAPFIRAINKIIPVSKSKEGYFTILDNSDRIHKGYTDSKYKHIYEYEDFAKDFRRLEVQRERLYKALEVERQKYEAKDVMVIKDDITEVDDLDYYR